MSTTRRRLLEAGAAFSVVALNVTQGNTQDRRLRLYFWGSKDRSDRTNRVNELFAQQSGGVTVTSELLGGTEYWSRMATEAAAKNLPDVIQTDYRYIFEYARRGAFMPLDSFIGKEIDVSDFGSNAVECGKVDGKLYGINLGNNSVAMIENLSLYERLGIPAPKIGTTWKQFAEISAAVHKASGGKIWGTSDVGGGEGQWECWLRQRGKVLYTADGQLGFGADDAAEWFDFWQQMRKTGGCVPPDIQSLYKDSVDTDLITLGKAAVGFANSNQLVAYQAPSRDKLAMTTYPFGEAGSKPGQYLKPAMFFSIAANSKMGPDAARYINFFCHNPEAVAALSVDRGVPASAASRLALAPVLDDLGKVAVAYISDIADKVGPLPPPPPRGASEIYMLQKRVNEEVGFGKLSVKAGAQTYFDEAISILERG